MVSLIPPQAGIKLNPASKVYTVEQDKARPPAETVAWVRRRFSGLGQNVLKETKRIDTGRLDIPVFLSLCGHKASALTSTAKQMGKGASLDQAEASALMELVERFSFFSYIKQTPFEYLRAGQAPQPCMDFQEVAKSLYHPQSQIDMAKQVFDLLPQRWAWAHNLTAGRDEAAPLGWFYAINEYNGPAAGNCQEEAVLQSLCEVIERHISAVVSLEKRPTPAIDPESIKDPVARDLIDKFTRQGIEVYLKDFTLDMGVPSVAALCYDPATFPAKSEIVYAAGTATSPTMALIRALTEVAQLAGDFETGSSYKVSALPKFATMEEAAYVTEAAGVTPLDSLPDVSRDDFRDEVLACVDALKERGFTVYSLDVTHEELLVPAVYTFVPGFHFAHRTTGTDVVFHAAKLASQLPDSEESLTVLEKMASAAPDIYYLPFFRALALINLERPQEALQDLDKALKLNPPAQDEASIHTQRGVALKDLGRFAEAQVALSKASAYPEPHPEVFNLLGFCFFKQEQYEDAIQAFSQAIKLDPGQAINYANIGTNLRELGRMDEACEMYSHALELDPSLDFARENLNRLKG
jgi:ribosomal protein S12 methylthiotransferase accessory factor